MVVSEAPPTRGPGGSQVVARLSGPTGRMDLFVALRPDEVRCAGCATDLSDKERCFVMRRVGAASVPVCTRCEPLPRGATVEWERVLHRRCAHPDCPHPDLVSRVLRSGDALEHAELVWEHEPSDSTWGAGQPVHRPWPERPRGG